MGFTCGLYKSKKLDNLDGKVLDALEFYLIFLRENIEAFEGFTTDLVGFEEYCKKHDLEYYKYSPEFANLVEQYQAKNERVFIEINYWCSGAVPFHEFLKSHKEFINFSCDYQTDIEFNKEDIFKCLRWCENYIDSKEFIPIVTNNAFKENSDDTITLIPCDGIEYTDEEGHLERSYSSTWDMTDIYICKECYNEWEVNTIKSIKSTLIDILENTNFEEERIFYKGGW